MTARGFRFQDTSDPELISNLYEDRGIDGLNKLRGVFSLAVLDHKRDYFYLVRDRLGVKPLYYSLVAGSVVFASRVASIFSSSSVTPEINPEALKYFFFGVRKSPETIFKHVLTVPPGHYLMINQNGHFVREYWDVRFPEHPAEPKHPSAYYVDELDALLTETVKLYMGNSDSPTALLLSGGLDSSTIGCLGSEVRDLHTYTIAVKTPRFKRHDESDDARLVAQHIGSRHTEFDYKSEHLYTNFLDTLRQLECPTYEVYIQSMISFYLVYKKMGEDGIKVVFSGVGADEILGGNPHHQIEKIRRWCQGRQERSWPQRLYQKVTQRSIEDHNFFKDVHEQILQTYGHNLASLMWIKGFAYIRDNLGKLLGDDVLATLDPDETTVGLRMDIDSAKYGHFHPFDQLLYLDLKTRLVDFALLEQQQLSQTSGVDLRLPFLDHRVVEYVATIPPGLKMRGLTKKYVLEKVARRYLPADLLLRKPRGFGAAFTREVFRDRPSSLANELLSTSALKDAGYFSPTFVAALLEQYRNDREHVNRAVSFFLLEQVLIIQGIHQVFIKRAS